MFSLSKGNYLNFRFLIFTLGKVSLFRIFGTVAIFKFRNLKSGQAMPLPPGEFTIGRSDQAYIHVEDPSVSRRHAKIYNRPEGLFVEDTESANGTAMQGTLVVGRKVLNIGDVVHIGSVPFRVDPEVGGDNVTPVAPMAGRRSINRDYMRRDTERLSVEMIDKAVEALSTDNEAAIADVAKETESAELEAIEAREPGTAAPDANIKGGWFHGTNAKPLAKAARPIATSQPTVVKAVTASKSTPSSGSGKGLLIMTFLGGMGAGILIGFILAKVL